MLKYKLDWKIINKPKFFWFAIHKANGIKFYWIITEKAARNYKKNSGLDKIILDFKDVNISFYFI